MINVNVAKKPKQKFKKVVMAAAVSSVLGLSFLSGGALAVAKGTLFETEGSKVEFSGTGYDGKSWNAVDKIVGELEAVAIPLGSVSQTALSGIGNSSSSGLSIKPYDNYITELTKKVVAIQENITQLGTRRVKEIADDYIDKISKKIESILDESDKTQASRYLDDIKEKMKGKEGIRNWKLESSRDALYIMLFLDVMADVQLSEKDLLVALSRMEVEIGKACDVVSTFAISGNSKETTEIRKEALRDQIEYFRGKSNHIKSSEHPVSNPHIAIVAFMYGTSASIDYRAEFDFKYREIIEGFTGEQEAFDDLEFYGQVIGAVGTLRSYSTGKTVGLRKFTGGRIKEKFVSEGVQTDALDINDIQKLLEAAKRIGESSINQYPVLKQPIEKMDKELFLLCENAEEGTDENREVILKAFKPSTID